MMQDFNNFQPSDDRQAESNFYNEAKNRSPQSVYGNNWHMGNFTAYANQGARFFERSKVKSLAFISGICMLGYLLMQGVLVYIFSIEGMWELYNSDYYFESGLSIFFSIVAIGLPFSLVYLFAKRRGYGSLNSFGKPHGKAFTTALIIMGFGLCLLASYITNIIYMLFQSAGVTLPYEDFTPPLEIAAVIMLFIKTAIVPALIEEFAVRGFLLQSMRKFGDGFAIVMSSLVFSLLHANAVQIPFAFMAGLVLGYVFCKTNSIWPPIIVHFLNNAFSCVETVIFAALPKELANSVDNILTIGIAVFAIISLIIVLMSKKSLLPKTHTYLSGGEKAKAFVFQPMFFIMALLYLGLTVVDVLGVNV